MSKVVIKECKDYNLKTLMLKINTGIEMIGGWSLFVDLMTKSCLR